MNWPRILWVAAIVASYVALSSQVVDLKSRMTIMEDRYGQR